MDVEIRGLDRLRQKWATFERRLRGDYMEMWHVVTSAMQQRVSDKWDAGGPGWRPTSPGFTAWKQARGYRTEIMRMTDNLHDSLLAPFGAHEYAIWDPQPHRLVWGTRARDERSGDPYAWWWQHGERPFLVDAELQPAADHATRIWLLRTLREAFD